MPSADSRPIYLVGMMGAGKSTVGAVLAARLERRFVDLDRLIEEWAGEPITAMIGGGREQEFRELERTVLRGFDAKATVIATGGGTPAAPTNLDYMLERGHVVYLRAELPTLMARVGDGAARPLLAEAPDRAARMRELYHARRGSYERATHVVDTDTRTLDEVVGALMAVLP